MSKIAMADSDFDGAGPLGLGQGGLKAWVVVIEATADSEQPPYSFDTVRRLVEHLGDRRATGLFCADRYAVQLDVQACGCSDALRVAMAAHRQAAAEVAMDAPSFLRAEVLTPEVLQTELVGEIGATPPLGSHLSVPAMVYNATRALLGATSVTEIRGVLSTFVADSGATVNAGPRPRQPGLVSVDMGLDPNDQLYATAEALSVSGMLIETSLPLLVDDARSAVRALRRQPDRR